MDSAEIATLTQELQEELALYHALIELNREQFAILDQGPLADTDAMVVFVGNKQKAMQRIEAVDANLRPKKESWKSARESLDASARAEVDSLLGELSDTIKTLIDMEDEAQQRLQALMSQNTASVDNIRKKSQVNKAYAAYGAKKPGPRYVDHKADGK